MSPEVTLGLRYGPAADGKQACHTSLPSAQLTSKFQAHSVFSGPAQFAFDSILDLLQFEQIFIFWLYPTVCCS